ncbi:MAG: sulfatase-like hydrolase/transferase [Bacteroidota bacterium]|nr:sulfatase-like hydrolase/transferase [Bacteroidota bacterium]
MAKKTGIAKKLKTDKTSALKKIDALKKIKTQTKSNVIKKISALKKGNVLEKIDALKKISGSEKVVAIKEQLSAKSKLKEYKEGTTFTGKIGKTVSESSPAWPEALHANEGAPNVLLWILDDVGYGQMSAFGGLIDTPNLDKLADNGLRYTNMHTTALCSPTRSCVLTGRNHHSNGIAAITEMSTGYPGYNGQMPFENGMLSEILLENGYNTFCIGKWHLSPSKDGTPAGPFNRWPLGRGFEKFYGFLGGETSQWYPDLVYDNHSVTQPKTPEEGYHLTEDLSDKAIRFVYDSHINAPGKPFFLYYATGAGHAPHQVGKKWIDKYKGKFDMGWDKYREIVFNKQKTIGIFPKDAVLSERDPDVPEWETLSAEQKKLYARFMEVYAGFISHTDEQFGRLLESLEKIDQLKNTIIVVLSDNGASSEGGVEGTFNEMSPFNNRKETFEEIFPKINKLGGTTSYNHYPWGWSWAGNTPFRRWKKEVYQGGCTDNCVIHWSNGIASKGELRDPYAHAIDLVPTILDALKIKAPKMIKGVKQSPIEGVSFEHTFDNKTTSTKHYVQYFEMFGCRAIDYNGWRAVCGWPGANYAEGLKNGHKFGDEIKLEILKELDETGWELFNIKKDPTESKNISKENPEILKKMIDRWWREARKYKVLPLDGSTLLRFKENRPRLIQDRSQYTFYPGLSAVPVGNAPPVYNRPHTITAEVEIPAGGAQGVILAHGGVAGGYTFFIKNNKLHYNYNYLGLDYFKVVSEEKIPDGKVTLKFGFLPTGLPEMKSGKGTPGTAQVYINSKLVGTADFPWTVPFTFGLEGLSCGYDSGEAVSSEYKIPFTFTGKIIKVTVEVFGTQIKDLLTELQALTGRQ